MRLVFYSFSQPICVIFFLFSTVHSLHLLFALTHLLLKENGCAPGSQSAMEKDGMQKSPASSRSLRLQMNSKSQREDFLQDGKTNTHTHTQKNPGELRRRLLGTQKSGSVYSDRDAQGTQSPPQSFCVGSRTCLTMGMGVARETTHRL